VRLLLPTFSPLPPTYRLLSRRTFLLMCVAVPPLLVTFWEGAGWAGAVSALIGAVWFSVVPAAFHSSRATAWACLSALVLFLVTLVTLPLHTAAFVVDAWSTLVMAFLSFPTRWSPPRRIKVATVRTALSRRLLDERGLSGPPSRPHTNPARPPLSAVQYWTRQSEGMATGLRTPLTSFVATQIGYAATCRATETRACRRPHWPAAASSPSRLAFGKEAHRRS
jgi:hypothetical protein